jgi:hypothetical protein
MTLTSSEVRVAGTGELFLAPLGTTRPLNPGTALDAAFIPYGYTTDDGVALARATERSGINAWQAKSPVRWVITGTSLTIRCSLLQSNKDSFKLWLGSGDFTQIGAAMAWKADIPVDPTSQQFAAVMEWKDGSITNRLSLEKVELTETGDITLTKTGYNLPVTLTAVPADAATVLATFLSNDPASDPS